MQQCIFFFRFDLGCWVGLTRWKDYLVLEIRSTVEQNAARSHATYRLLKKQRRALRSLCDYLLPVTKGVEKPPRKLRGINSRIPPIRLFENPYI